MRRILILLISLTLSACCSTMKSLPSDISLRDALIQVRDGIQEIQKRPSDSKSAGLLLSEVQVTFNVTANSKDTSKLGLDLAPANFVKEIPTGSFEKSSEVALGRSNQISFKFQNVFLAGKDSLVGLSVAPITITTEKSVTKEKEKESTTEKVSRLAQPLTLEQLYELLDSKLIIMTPPPATK